MSLYSDDGDVHELYSHPTMLEVFAQDALEVVYLERQIKPFSADKSLNLDMLLTFLESVYHSFLGLVFQHV